jgi:predicted dehydrogenase
MTATEPADGPGRPPIRVGVIGATPLRGWGTTAHLPALQALGEFEIAAVSTTRLETATATAAEFGVPLAFADDARLISHPEVDVVAVTVKVPEHDRLVRAALAAGKHVFCEWPLGVGSAQAAELAALAREQGVHHLVGLQGYQAPGAVFVRELIDSGEIGRLLTVSAVAAGGPAGIRVPQANAYAADVRAGATVLSITAGHILSTLARAVGELASVSAVVASINREATIVETGQVIPVTAPDQVVVAGRLDNGAALSVSVQGGGAPAGPGFEVRIVGTEATLTIRPAAPGAIHIADWAISIARADGSSDDLPVPGRLTSVAAAVPAGPPRNVAVLYRELSRAMAGGPPAAPDFDAAVRHHRLLETIERASDTGARQDVAAG